jgi:hypothetical protein
VIFEPDVELLPRDRLRALQTERLRALVAGICDIDDVRDLPFTRQRVLDRRALG